MDRRRVTIGIVIVVLVIGGAAGGYYYYSRNLQARTEILRQLDITSAQRAGSLLASGFIEAEEVEISAEMGGRVVDLPFQEGDEVTAGDVLVQLDTALLEAQRDIAHAQLDIVQAQRDLLDALPREEVLRQAQAQVAIAQATLDSAAVVWTDTAVIASNPQDIAIQLAEAQTQAAAAQEELVAAQVQLRSAERAQQLYYDALAALPDAEQRLQRLTGNMELELSLPFESTMAPKRYEQAWINLQSAQEVLADTQELLASLQDLRDNPQTLYTRVAEARTSFEAAQAALARAQAELKSLEGGPSQEEIAIADARIEEARAALGAIEAQITRMTLRAPIGGIVLDQTIHEGELAVPGVPLVTLANLDVVELTVYITAVQLDEVRLNQEVRVTVDSFPNRTFTGVISHIADKAEFTPRSVQTREERVNLVYAITIRLENPDHALKPGMPADARLDSQGW